MTKKFKLFTGNRYKEVIEHIKKLDTYFAKDYLDSPYVFVIFKDKGYESGVFMGVNRFYEDTEYEEISVDEFLELKPLEYVEGYRMIGTGDVEDGFRMALTDPTFSVFTKHDYALAHGNLPRLIYLRDKYDREYKDGVHNIMYEPIGEHSYYTICCDKDNGLEKQRISGCKTLLSFVNMAARDKFFDEQKELIVKCKAFL